MDLVGAPGKQVPLRVVGSCTCNCLSIEVDHIDGLLTVCTLIADRESAPNRVEKCCQEGGRLASVVHYTAVVELVFGVGLSSRDSPVFHCLRETGDVHFVLQERTHGDVLRCLISQRSDIPDGEAE